MRHAPLQPVRYHRAETAVGRGDRFPPAAGAGGVFAACEARFDYRGSTMLVDGVIAGFLRYHDDTSWRAI